ncbi:MAG: VOC family protein [Devosia sp.]|nr:VOC family protein [Devosia sp.]
MEDWIAQPGLMLFTENYAACVAFYRDTLGLPVLFDKGYLVTLGFGSGYIMIEKEGVAVPGGKSRAQSPVTLRFNVEDVEAAAAMLQSRGVEVDVRHWDWGITGAFLDPDGNYCELKDQHDGFFAPRG